MFYWHHLSRWIRAVARVSSALYLEAGAGYTSFHSNHSMAFGHHGSGWSGEIGWDFRAGRSLVIAPFASYSRGTLGETRNALGHFLGWKYDVVMLGVGVFAP